MNLKTFLLTIGFCLALVLPQKARSAHPSVETVLLTSAGGILVGTGIGLIVLPFSGDIRTLFMGSSVGLYMGIVVGGYLALTGNYLDGFGNSPAYGKKEEVRFDLAFKRASLSTVPPLFEVSFEVF